MSMFTEQLKMRKASEERFENIARNELLGALAGKAYVDGLDEQRVVQSAIEEVLKYYHFEPKPVDDEKERFSSLDNQLELSLRPFGIMRRRAKLTRGWFKSASGPMIGCLKKDGRTVALIPRKSQGYYYYDFEQKKRIGITSRNEDDIANDVYCFYRPLPMKKLTIIDIILFIKDQLEISDIVKYVAILGATSIIGLMVPLFSQWLFGDILEIGSVSLLAGLAVFIACFTVCQLCFGVYKSLISNKIMAKGNMALEAAVMHRLFNMPASFFKQYAAGELSSRASQMNSLCQTIVDGIGNTGITAVFSLIYIGQIFTFAPAMAGAALVIVAVTIASMLFFTFAQMRISTRRMEVSAKESGMTYAMLTGIQKIKLAGAENRMFARWERLYAKVAQLAYNPPIWLKLQSTINLAISLFGTVLLYSTAIGSNVAVADYYAFTAAYGMVSGAFMSLAGIVVTVANIKPTLTMVAPIMETAPEIAEGKEMVKQLQGGISIEHVSFRYNDDMPYVIDDLSLTVKPHEYLAIVGTTGCGKSTLLRLLLGFEKPQTGGIFYDNHDMSQVDMKSLRSKMGVVLQDGKLMNGDVFQNISVSNPTMTMSEAWEVAEMASVADDIRAMPMGMRTLISEGQGGISGGQRQRLMIARALAGKPKILMFDEATSALDNITQRKVSEAIDSLDCTRIVIAHRLSTIMNCDRIIMLDKGCIVEDGTYEELIAKGGMFAELVERQRIDV